MVISSLKFIKSKFIFVFFPSLVFLIIGISTLSDYGMNWDEPIHFMRGQAYLHYFLTGEKDYKSLHPYPRLVSECPPKVKNCAISPIGPVDRTEYLGNITYEDAVLKNATAGQPWRSYYQHDDYTYNEFIKMEDGHPPLGGIFAAVTNKIFYQDLKIMHDVESYHLSEVLISFLIVFAVSVFVYYNFGVYPAFFAGVTIASYPLFFGESHFNIKDPALASFYGLTIITFYFGIIKNNWKILVISAILAGLAMGIKFNILFLPLIIGPWFVFYLCSYFFKNMKKYLKLKKLMDFWRIGIALVFYPVVVFLVFYMLWPVLWPDPVNNFLKTLSFYEQIGLGTPPELSKYLIRGWNTYPLQWIMFTTPIPVLALVAVGGIGSTFDFIFKRKHLPVLMLLWLTIPILRVSYPGTSIYGGVRQIMEYVPALTALAGAGVYYLLLITKATGNVLLKYIVILMISVSMIFTVYEVASIHPNENVYFNQLIGGLSGARDRAIPYWGNSYGNVYQQGIEWLNANAEAGAKLGFPVSTGGNLTRVKLRPDINYLNSHWSGPNMGGEYEMELYFDWGPREWYSYAYYDTFVEPVFVAQVDGVPLLKVWKNDFEHTRPQYREEVEYKIVQNKSEDGILFLDLGQVVPLTRIVIEHSKEGCDIQKGGFIETSTDGLTWKRDEETIASPQVPTNVNGWDEDTFVFMFAARSARYISVNTQMKDSCILKTPKIIVKGIKS